MSGRFDVRRQRFEGDGEAGLLDRRLGKVSLEHDMLRVYASRHDLSGSVCPFAGDLMRRSEALQGVRVMRFFLTFLGRYEAAQFNQMEAAELLRVDERTFRRWRQRFEGDAEAGAFGSSARQGVDSELTCPV